jgi:hypothetical protein
MDNKQHNHRRGFVALLMTVLLGGCQQDNHSAGMTAPSTSTARFTQDSPAQPGRGRW